MSRGFLLLVLLAVASTETLSEDDTVKWLVRRWAPLVWLAPAERFLPGDVEHFLQKVVAIRPNATGILRSNELPKGTESKSWYLLPKLSVEDLLNDESSLLHGKSPQITPVPVYAVIKRCWQANNLQSGFHVTYWMFYPYSEGKDTCTVNLGRFLGPLPIPQVFDRCLGSRRVYGSHVGDWEHMSLSFSPGRDHPDVAYVSTHDSGVYYRWNASANIFTYERQETRYGVLQKPVFPRALHVKTGRPILFSARGSHGLWSRPGLHRYVRIPRLVDSTGYGIPWETWRHVVIIDRGSTPSWLQYKGRWGPPKARCQHTLNKFGVDVCEINDGPTGIPLKKQNFNCTLTLV